MVPLIFGTLLLFLVNLFHVARLANWDCFTGAELQSAVDSASSGDVIFIRANMSIAIDTSSNSGIDPSDPVAIVPVDDYWLFAAAAGTPIFDLNTPGWVVMAPPGFSLHVLVTPLSNGRPLFAISSGNVAVVGLTIEIEPSFVFTPPLFKIHGDVKGYFLVLQDLHIFCSESGSACFDRGFLIEHWVSDSPIILERLYLDGVNLRAFVIRGEDVFLRSSYIMSRGCDVDQMMRITGAGVLVENTIFDWEPDVAECAVGGGIDMFAYFYVGAEADRFVFQNNHVQCHDSAVTSYFFKFIVEDSRCPTYFAIQNNIFQGDCGIGDSGFVHFWCDGNCKASGSAPTFNYVRWNRMSPSSQNDVVTLAGDFSKSACLPDEEGNEFADTVYVGGPKPVPGYLPDEEVVGIYYDAVSPTEDFRGYERNYTLLYSKGPFAFQDFCSVGQILYPFQDSNVGCSRCRLNRDESSYPLCDVCIGEFSPGFDCLVCPARRDPGSNCTTCINNYDQSSYPACDDCPNQSRRQSDCGDCRPAYLSPECDECVGLLYGTDCDQCPWNANPNGCLECQDAWEGPSCQDCPPNFDEEHCQFGRCLPAWTGTICDQSVEEEDRTLEDQVREVSSVVALLTLISASGFVILVVIVICICGPIIGCIFAVRQRSQVVPVGSSSSVTSSGTSRSIGGRNS